MSRLVYWVSRQEEDSDHHRKPPLPAAYHSQRDRKVASCALSLSHALCIHTQTGQRLIMSHYASKKDDLVAMKHSWSSSLTTQEAKETVSP